MSPKSRNRPRPTSRQRSLLAQRLAQGLRKRGWDVSISRMVRGMASPRPGSRRWRRHCRRVQAMFRRESRIIARAARILDSAQPTAPTATPAE